MRHRNPALRLNGLDLAVREGHERYENDLVSIKAIIENILWLGWPATILNRGESVVNPSLHRAVGDSDTCKTLACANGERMLWNVTVTQEKQYETSGFSRSDMRLFICVCE